MQTVDLGMIYIEEQVYISIYGPTMVCVKLVNTWTHLQVVNVFYCSSGRLIYLAIIKHVTGVFQYKYLHVI